MPAWEQLSINKPHLAYLILGGFTSLFMLCSLFVKEKLYIGEATVATICGVIFGPHAANLFNPASWGNVDQITLECSRVVLVVQCFAVGVELPKSYMERHWRSVVFLLVPVMTFGWLMTSLFIWWMIEPLTWLESLACAACVTATDPVLASSVVGKGKFAKRVPKHLRDILSAESGCNDGMAFPFIYLSFYIIQYRPNTSEVAYHWFCHTILYECIFGAIYGVLIGYMGRHAIKWADSKGLIDRESFLVFYFTLALFCAGTGSLLGTDDLLVGFAAGVGFSNDGWFTHKTEESHVSNVIDLLLNLAYFVYFGAIIPWEQFNAPEIGLTPWKLVVIAIFVLLFRRIPIMMALKPIIPDIKTWREALFAGHFGPIGVGAIYAAILARAELETDTTEPLADIPTDPATENYAIVQVIWPLTTFLVVTSIIVHGSSIAVFTLGKRINTLTLTMSYTQANEEGPSWMNRLPRIQSTSKSMSKAKSDFSVESSSEEKLPEYPPGTLPPIGLPGNFLRRQKEEDTPIEGRRSNGRRKSKWDSGMGPGGPISQSAITPIREQFKMNPEDSVSDTLNEKGTPSPDSRDEGEPPDQLEMEVRDEKRKKKHENDSKHIEEPTVEAYQEGHELVVEDEEGNILSVSDTRGETDNQKQQHIYDAERSLERETSGEHAKGKYHPHEKDEGEEIEKNVMEGLEHPEQAARKWLQRLGGWRHKDKGKDEGPSEPKPVEHKRGPAHAYQFGNTIIVEDEDGEVVKKYEIPNTQARGGRGGYQDGPSDVDQPMRQGLKRMGTWAHLTKETADPAPSTAAVEEKKEQPPRWYRKFSQAPVPDDPNEDNIRFTVETGGRRMSKQDFIDSMRQLDPKARIEAVEDSDAPTGLKQAVQAEAVSEHQDPSRPEPRRESTNPSRRFPSPNKPSQLSPQQEEPEGQEAAIQKVTSREDHPTGDKGLTLVDSNDDAIPFHSVPSSITKYTAGQAESAAAARRRRAAQAIQEEDSDDDGTERVPPHHIHTSRSPSDRRASTAAGDAGGETAAEKRRRLAALGERKEESDSEDDNTERKPKGGHEPVKEPERRERGVRFADAAGGQASATGSGTAVGTGTGMGTLGRVQWGEGVGRRRGK